MLPIFLNLFPSNLTSLQNAKHVTKENPLPHATKPSVSFNLFSPNLTPPQNQYQITKETNPPFHHSTSLTFRSNLMASLPALRLRKLRRLPSKLLRDRQPDHDVQSDGLLAAQELDLLRHLEPESAVEFQVEDVAAFEVADAVFDIGLYDRVLIKKNTRSQITPLFSQKKNTYSYSYSNREGIQIQEEETKYNHMLTRPLNQTFRIPLPPRAGLRANVDEIPRIGVVFAEDVLFGVVQEGEELVEEAPLAFFGELPVEAEHAAPEHGAEIVHVFVGGHPVFWREWGFCVSFRVFFFFW